MSSNKPQDNRTLNLLVNSLVMASCNLAMIIVCSLWPNLIVHVDDVLIMGNSKVEINKVKNFLNQKFTVKDLGNERYFLGLELARFEDGIFVDQWKYVMELLQDTGMIGCRPASTPLPKNLKLIGEDGELLEDPLPFRCLIGRLLNLRFTRPDLPHVTQQLSQFIPRPRTSHWNTIMHVLTYIKVNSSLGVFFPATNSLKLEGFCDANWGSCTITRRNNLQYPNPQLK